MPEVPEEVSKYMSDMSKKVKNRHVWTKEEAKAMSKRAVEARKNAKNKNKPSG